MLSYEADPPSCPHCESVCLIRVGLMREITFYRCDYGAGG